MSYPRYPKYKDSGVEWLGEVPEHWEVLPLKHAASVFPSNVDKKSYDDEAPVRLCNYTDVYYNDEITPQIDFMAATASAEQVAKFTLRRGDTVITKDSESADDIAVAAFVPADLPGVVCGYHLSVVRPHPGYEGGFIKRLFDASFLKAQVAVLANGLTRVGLAQSDIDSLLLPFPPRDEQQRIADVLAEETLRIDALIVEQQRLIELLKEKRQAVISHAVTKGLNPDAPMKPSRVDGLGDVPAHWSVTPLKHEVGSIEQGWSPQCDSFPVESDDEWGVLKVGCVNGGSFEPRENKSLPKELEPIPELGLQAGDVLVSRANTRELVGSAAVIDRDYRHLMLCDKLYRLRVSAHMSAEYLAIVLGTPAARSRIMNEATGASASMVNVGQGTILNIPIALPPLAEQRTILDSIKKEVQSLNTLMNQCAAAIALLQERRTALISAAVTGKIDVRNLSVSAEPHAAVAS